MLLNEARRRRRLLSSGADVFFFISRNISFPPLLLSNHPILTHAHTTVNATALTSGNIAPIYSYHAWRGNTCSHIWHLCRGLNSEFQVVLFIDESQSVGASCGAYAAAHESLIFPVYTLYLRSRLIM